jgi:TldD protein
VSQLSQLQDLFFVRAGINENKVKSIVTDTLRGADEGELYLEFAESEALVFDDQKLKQSSYNVSSGFGLRAITGDSTAYAFSSQMNEAAIAKAATAVKASNLTSTKMPALNLDTGKHSLYISNNPMLEHSYASKIALLKNIDSYIRNKSPLVKQVSASLMGSWQAVLIMQANGQLSSDIRPLVRINISVIVEKDGRMESGSMGTGGRTSYQHFVSEHNWQQQADEALRQALINLESIPAPAGEMTVVLGPGWPGVLLHEAVGHGLEGDFNRKKVSAFSNLLGKRVAAPGVTIIDEGSIPDRRGSLNIDDEGTPTERTVLIEDGILCSYMQDKMNARLMGHKPTGNGRRESYAHQPLPRMTNTYMLGGDKNPSDIIASVKKGLYAVNFGGGQVDITSGKFVFSTTEAYLIENGQVTSPVKGATLIGNGPDILTKVSAIGNDSTLDPGVGNCGKNGQNVPVGVGQPTLLIDSFTVGGTDT